MIEHVIDLPFPPSVNRLYRVAKGRIILSKEYRDWKHDANLMGLTQRVGRLQKITGEYEITIQLDASKKRRPDQGNTEKAVSDILQAWQLIENDRNAQRTVIEWVNVTGCRVILRGVSQSTKHQASKGAINDGKTIEDHLS